MENRRSRCINIISCLIIAVCLISFTDGDDLSEDNIEEYDGDSDNSTKADENSSTATDAESKEVLQAFTQDPTSSANSFIVTAFLESETTDDNRTTQNSTISNNTIIQTSPKNRPTGDKGTTHISTSIPSSSKTISIIQTSPKDGPSDDDDDYASEDFNQYPARSVVTAPMQSKNGPVDHYNDKGSKKTEKSPTTVLILAGLIAVIISAGLSICISYCVASTIVKKKGYNKSDKMTESQGDVPLDQIVCTSVQSTEESSKPCNEEGVSVEGNQHENEQAASKDEDVVLVADNQTNDETKVANEQDNEAAKSVTEDKDNNEASEAAIKLFVEQCMSGENVNNANAATGSLLTEPQPTEKASVDATASIPSVDATNINAAPIDQPIDMPNLNAAAVDPPQT